MQGRAAVARSAFRRNHSRQDSRREHHDEDDDQIINTDDILLVEKDRKLIMRRYPFALWIGGAFILICSSYMLYHLISGSLGILFNGYQEGFWWQYVIVSILFLLSFAFFFSGKVETVTFNKEDKIFTNSKQNLFCRKQFQQYSLDSVISIAVVRRGHKGVSVNTIHYKVVIRLENERQIRILETSSKSKAKRQGQVIRRFLGDAVLVKEIQYIDESTTV